MACSELYCIGECRFEVNMQKAEINEIKGPLGATDSLNLRDMAIQGINLLSGDNAAMN